MLNFPFNYESRYAANLVGGLARPAHHQLHPVGGVAKPASLVHSLN